MMKFKGLLFLVLVFLHWQCAALTNEQQSIRIELMDGSSTNLATLLVKGPVYIKFWVSWCQTCMQQMPHFQEVHEEYEGKVTVLGVNVWLNESMPDVKKVIDKFSLTLPIVFDKSGELTEAFNFIGTPFHLLIDPKGRVVHSGYEADEMLDQKISLLATGKLIDDTVVINAPTSKQQQFALTSLTKETEQPTLLYFTSTWCDWYLEETRPAMAKQCVDSQQWLNKLKLSNANIVVSHLWTQQKEVNEYQEKYNITLPIILDKNNHLFDAFKVKQFPTLIVIQQGKELVRFTNFESLPTLTKNLLALNIK